MLYFFCSVSLRADRAERRFPLKDFEIFTDSSSNLTQDLAEEYDISIIPFHCYPDENTEISCYEPGKPFDGHAFYEALRKSGPIRTSMVNSFQFTQAFEPVLKAGRDILFFAMSSGISGTCAAAVQAAEALMKKYAGRVVKVVDTIAASLGEGIFPMKAAEMRRKGLSLEECRTWAENNKRRLCQYFTVDDLTYLYKGGRISGITARIATIANIKPLLKGDSDGKIVSCGKVIGRKKSLQAIADLFAKEAVHDPDEVVAIAHTDCESDANYLAGLLRKVRNFKDILIRCYEPCTGSHVGPGAVALFFFAPTAIK